jgi:hypothetical protein
MRIGVLDDWFPQLKAMLTEDGRWKGE